jgi:predicted RNase H-like HicB family nuclease
MPEAEITRYAVVFEDAGRNWAAYVPDLPGCVATARTLDECKSVIAEAIRFHLDGMRADGLPLPPPVTVAEHIAA